MKSIRFALLLLVAAALPARAAGSPARPSDAADFDTTCAPCRDFDQFANGGWKARTKLPAGYSNYGAFDELYDRNEAVLRKVLEAAAASRSPAERSRILRSTASLRSYSSSNAP